MPNASSDRSADLRARLRRVGLAARRPPAPAAAATPSYSADESQPIEAVVPGRVVETQAGPCYLVETRYALHEAHGHAPLSDLLGCSGKLAAQLAAPAGAEGIDPGRFLFHTGRAAPLPHPSRRHPLHQVPRPAVPAPLVTDTPNLAAKVFMSTSAKTAFIIQSLL